MRATRKRIRSHLLLCFLFSSFAQSRTLYSHTYRKDNSIIRCEETLHNKRLGSATFVFSNRVFHQDVALLDHNVKTSIRSNRIEKCCILRCIATLIFVIWIMILICSDKQYAPTPTNASACATPLNLMLSIMH